MNSLKAFWRVIFNLPFFLSDLEKKEWILLKISEINALNGHDIIMRVAFIFYLFSTNEYVLCSRRDVQSCSKKLLCEPPHSNSRVLCILSECEIHSLTICLAQVWSTHREIYSLIMLTVIYQASVNQLKEKCRTWLEPTARPAALMCFHLTKGQEGITQNACPDSENSSTQLQHRVHIHLNILMSSDLKE